jgi:hypothetical protein
MIASIIIGVVILMATVYNSFFLAKQIFEPVTMVTEPIKSINKQNLQIILQDLIQHETLDQPTEAYILVKAIDNFISIIERGN